MFLITVLTLVYIVFQGFTYVAPSVLEELNKPWISEKEPRSPRKVGSSFRASMRYLYFYFKSKSTCTYSEFFFTAILILLENLWNNSPTIHSDHPQLIVAALIRSIWWKASGWLDKSMEWMIQRSWTLAPPPSPRDPPPLPSLPRTPPTNKPPTPAARTGPRT